MREPWAVGADPWSQVVTRAHAVVCPVVGSPEAEVLSPDEAIHAVVANALTLQLDDWLHRRYEGLRSAGWDGRVPMFKRVDEHATRMPVGYARGAVNALQARGYTVEGHQGISIPPVDRLTGQLDFGGLAPWPHQRRVIDTLLGGATNPVTDDAGSPCIGRLGVVSACTGSGKTLMLAGTIMGYGVPRTLVLCPKAGLVVQTAEALKRLLPKRVVVGRWDGQVRELAARVVVATPHAIAAALRDPEREQAALDFLRLIELLQLDEAQRMAGESASTKTDPKFPEGIWSAVAWRCPAPLRFAYSGTPFTERSRQVLELQAHFGELVASVGYSELVESGLLARPYFVYVMQQSGLDRYHGDQRTHVVQNDAGCDEVRSIPFSSLYSEAVVKNDDRTAGTVSIVSSMSRVGLRTLVTVLRVNHGKELVARLTRELGRPVPFVSGSMSGTDQANSFRAFDESPAGSVLVASTVVDEGIDMPSVDGLVLAGGGNAHVPTLQRIGRGMRRKGGDNRVLVVDIMDTTHVWLSRHAIKRADEYGAVGTMAGAFVLLGSTCGDDWTETHQQFEALLAGYVAGREGA